MIINSPALGDSRLAGVLQLVMAATVFSTVMAFGGVLPFTWMTASAIVVLCTAAGLCKFGWPKLPLAVNCLLGALMAVPLLQLVPLPRAVLRLLSPARIVFVDSLLSVPHDGRIPLSVVPHQTVLAVLKLTACVCIFVFGAMVVRSTSRLLLTPFLIALGLVEAGYGLYQYLTGSAYVFSYMSPLAVAHGTFINRNNYAGLLGMILPFVAANLICRGFGSSSGSGSGRGDHSGRWALGLVTFALLLLGLLFSESRGAIVAGMVSCVLAAWLALLRTRRKETVVVVVAVFLLPVVYAIWIGVTPVVDRMEAAVGTQAMADSRWPIWRDSASLVRDYPWLGSGLGTYGSVIRHYQTAFLDMRYEHAHNEYLEYASELGIPLTVLLFGALWVLAVRLVRRCLASEREDNVPLIVGCVGSLVCVLLHAGIDFDLQMPGVAMVFAWVAGTAVALRSSQPLAPPFRASRTANKPALRVMSAQ